MSDDPSPLDFNPFDGDFGDAGDRTLADAMVKARKVHVCFHCAGPIEVGEMHRSRRDIMDGDLMSFRWCALCCAAMLETMRDRSDEDEDDDREMAFERRHPEYAQTEARPND